MDISSSSSSNGRNKQSYPSSTTFFYNHHHEQQRPTSSSSTSAAAAAPAPALVEKEHMFDKVVTPSDVGKLNRLVIPKQHAEKYFPLDSAANDNKGLLLTFEDRTGKPWRFRYSYWNSSQSYVMTKGWSRFVKEKRLDAGDTVSFGRGVGAEARDRLFIDWRRRPPEAAPPPNLLHRHHHHHQHPLFMAAVPPFLHYFPSPATLYDHHLRRQSFAGAGECMYGPVLESVPVAAAVSTSAAAAKRVRLFGVNLDCPEPPPPVGYEEEEAAAGGDTPSPSARMVMMVQPPHPSSSTAFFGAGGAHQYQRLHHHHELDAVPDVSALLTPPSGKKHQQQPSLDLGF